MKTTIKSFLLLSLLSVLLAACREKENKVKTINLLRRLLSAGSPADFAQKLDALQLPGRKLLPLYPLAKPLFRLLRTGMVRDLQRTLRRLGLGRYVDARAAAELADRPILPYLEWILLQFMDGSAHPVGRDSAVYRLVLSVIEIPAHLLPGNMDMKKLIDLCLRCYFDRRRRRSPAVDFISAFGALPFFTAAGRFFCLAEAENDRLPP